MSLKDCSNHELIENVKALVSKERSITLTILKHLEEIETRRLYAYRGYRSMHEFVVSELGYSDGAAHRRIQAMRLVKSEPEVKKKIQEGSLSLTNAASLQSFLRSEKKINNKTYTRSEKNKLISKIENNSSRSCQKILREISPKAAPKQSVKILDSNTASITFTADDQLMKKIEQARNLLGFRLGSAGFAELIELLCDVTINKLDKSLGAAKGKKRASAQKLAAKNGHQGITTKRPYISKAIVAEIYKKWNNQCSFVDPFTKRGCTSRHHLELDHVLPLGMGGKSETSNLRLLCGAHNKIEAMKRFGGEKMRMYMAYGKAF